MDLKTTNNGKSLVGQFYSNNGGIIKDKFIIEKSSSVNRSLADTTPINNLAICDKLVSSGNALFDEWKQEHITDQQVLLLGELTMKLMTKFGCGVNSVEIPTMLTCEYPYCIFY